MRKKIVVIGGGNGSAVTLVSLKQNIKNFDITAAISMADSGGSSGRLRRELSTLPPGDIMRAVLGLSAYDYPTLRAIFYTPRFKEVGRLSTHNFGNLFLTLCTKYCGDFMAALTAFSQSVQAQGKVYPITLNQVDLVARLENGETVHTEEFIDTPTYNRGWKIKKVWLQPKAVGFKPVIKDIKLADYIIFAPGSLYTSLVASLLPVGIKSAIKSSQAKIIYLAGNAFRKDGETGPERLSDFINQLEKYLPRSLDLVVYNSHIPQGKKEKKFYKEKKWGLIEFDKVNLNKNKVVSIDLEREGGGLCSIKLGKLLKKILR